MGDLWAIVLAGGCGKRLESESVRRYGYPRPKQFCDFDGRGTLLQQTIDRALLVVPEERVAVVTTRACRREALESLAPWPGLLHLEQPEGRDTAPGLLLPLLAVLRRDPGAIVAVLPSDHHVAHPRPFVRALERAAASARTAPGEIVLLGARLDLPEDGYGWITRARGGRVERFDEKPSADALRQLVDSGALVNTFVMVGAASAFSWLFARWVPAWWQALVAAGEDAASVEGAYACLPPVNFSHAVLEHAVPHLRAQELGPVGWTDVGTPERLRRAMPSPAAHAAM
jgi:mannose-1-phosphate guanylyltransferase